MYAAGKRYINLLLPNKSSDIMVVELLSKLGLSQKEIEVYLALLEIGQTKTGPLVKKTRIPSSKIYHVLGTLIDKGLVGSLQHGGVKLFKANPPMVLRHLVERKENELKALNQKLEDALPSLEQEFLMEKPDYNVEILEGLRGIKSVYDLTLDLTGKGEEMCTIGYPLLASTLLNAYFKEYHKKLAKKRVHARILYDHDTWFGKKRAKRPHAKQKYLPKGIHTPAFVHIFKGHIAIMVVTEKQKLCILIKNKEVSESYQQYFDLLWKTGKQAKKR